MNFSLPGSLFYGILQSRIMQWVAISFPGELPDPGIEPRSPTLQADTIPSEPPGKQNAGLVEAQAGIKIVGRKINNLRYADDTTHMAESKEELKSLFMKVRVKKLA